MSLFKVLLPNSSIAYLDAQSEIPAAQCKLATTAVAMPGADFPFSGMCQLSRIDLSVSKGGFERVFGNYFFAPKINVSITIPEQSQ